MSRFFSYLNTARELVAGYHGEEPFARYSRIFFSAHKKYGSNDRKLITHLCYSCFRLGFSAPTLSIEEKVLAGVFLTSNAHAELLSVLKPGWEEKLSLDIPGKISFLRSTGIEIDADRIFPVLPLSQGIDRSAFSISHLSQPDLFIRIRPGFEEQVIGKLQNAGISFKRVGEQALAFDNQTRLDDLLTPDQEIVIQDLSSQKVAGFIPELSQGARVWDCCAGSGGKSFLVADRLSDLILTVSDIRRSILSNLEERFQTGKIRAERLLQLDLRDPAAVPGEKFDLVIADVPCTGSGTWGRTPEQLMFFDPASVEKFSELQKKISVNIYTAVRPGGYLLYITCSVFRDENEQNVQFLREKTGMVEIKSGIIAGYGQRADTLYACLLQKP